MAKLNSKIKGKRGELELANKLKSIGYNNARRSQQFAGINGDADVIGVDGVHIECKRRESGHGKLYEWLQQSKDDNKNDEDIPIVCHRKNREDWLVTLSLDDFFKLIKE